MRNKILAIWCLNVHCTIYVVQPLEGILSQCYTDYEELLLLPVTSASVELANSSLGLIKSPRRNSMTENQLTIFLFLFCNRDIFVITFILIMLQI